MAQQRHSSEIVLSIDDTHVARAIQRLEAGFKGLQGSATKAVAQHLNTLDKAFLGGAGREVAAAGYYAGSGLMSVGRGAMAVGRGISGVGGGILSGVAGAVPIVGGLLRPLLEARRRRTGEAQELEALLAELVAGSRFSTEETTQARTAGVEFGYSPAQALQTMRGFSRATQMAGSPTQANMRQLMQAERLGIGVQAIGGFAAGGALGGGAVGNVQQETQVALQLAGYARQLGLTGAGAERFLASIAQATQRMAQQGLSLDTEDLGRFVQGVNDAAENATIKGIGAMRATQRLMGMGGAALGGFRSQFGQIGQGVIQAAAAQGSSSPLAMIERLEELSASPTKLMDALRSMNVSDELIKLALVGAGASSAEARALMGAQPPESLKGGVPDRKEEALLQEQLSLSIARANIDQTMLSLIEQNKQASIALMNIAKVFEESALSMTRRDSPLSVGLVKLANSLEGLPDKVNDLVTLLSNPSMMREAIGQALREIKDELF